MSNKTRIKKHGVILPISIEAALGFSDQEIPPASKGQYRKLTTVERMQWREARDAIKLLEKSPWVYWHPDDGYVLKEPRSWVTEEQTH